jgi:hypothetical protein
MPAGAKPINMARFSLLNASEFIDYEFIQQQRAFQERARAGRIAPKFHSPP